MNLKGVINFILLFFTLIVIYPFLRNNLSIFLGINLLNVIISIIISFIILKFLIHYSNLFLKNRQQKKEKKENKEEK